MDPNRQRRLAHAARKRKGRAEAAAAAAKSEARRKKAREVYKLPRHDAVSAHRLMVEMMMRMER